MMTQKIITLAVAVMFSFSSYAVGVIEAAGALAVGQELARQSVQNTAPYLKQAKEGAKNYENALKQRARALEQAEGRSRPPHQN